MDDGMATGDFRRARRRAEVEMILGRLRGRPAHLVCYSDVHDLVTTSTGQYLGVQDIPLHAVVGSLGRCSDYTRGFLPLRDSDESRWARVSQAVTGSKRLPAIQVYGVSQIYLVADGHHRVSIARQRGMTHIRAQVYEVRTRVPLAPDVQIRDLAAKAAYAHFLERTRLDEARPHADLSMTIAGGYPLLDTQIEAHRHRMSTDPSQPIAMEDVVGSWYDTIYLPQLEVIRDSGMVRELPGRTETDLYVWSCEHRAIVSQALGWAIDAKLAVEDLVRQHSTRPQRRFVRLAERVFHAVLPENLRAAPLPGSWRRQRWATPQDGCRFARILVPVRGEASDGPALAQAAEIACRENARLLGLHVVPSTAEKESQEALVMRDAFDRRCQAVGVEGMLAVEEGQMARRIAERSRWADLVVLGLAQPPARLKSELRQLIRRSPTPILAVPGSFSYLHRPLLAYDGSPKAREALFIAAYLALREGAVLGIVSVEDDSVDASEVLADARAYLQRHGVEATYVQERGPVANAILTTAEVFESDLILMGGYGHSPLLETMRRSTVDDVLQAARQPVLICR
jgi:nucleotide-binding universal stress UspA family protein